MAKEILNSSVNDLFISLWSKANNEAIHRNELELMFDCDSSALFYVKDRGDGLMECTNFFDADQKHVIEKKGLLTIREFISRKNKERTSTNSANTVFQQSANQAQTKHKTGIKQANDNNKTSIEHAKNENGQSTQLIEIKTLQTRKLENINKLSKRLIRNTSDRNHDLKNRIENIVINAEIAAANKDLKQLSKFKKELIGIENKQQAALTAQLSKRPDQTLEDYIKEHYAAVRFITNNSLINKYTNGFYKGFNKLPENMPNQIVKALVQNKVLSPIGKPYGRAALTNLSKRVKEYNELPMVKVKRLLKQNAIAAGVLILVVFCFNIFLPTHSKNKVSQPQMAEASITITQAQKDSLLKVKLLKAQNLTKWRINTAKTKLELINNLNDANNFLYSFLTKRKK